MNGKERQIIRNNTQILAGGNNYDQLFENLAKRGVFNLFMVQEIQSRTNEVSDVEEKLKLLYEYILTRGPAAFEHLISALGETGNDDLASILHKKRYGTEIDFKINVKVNGQHYKDDEFYKMGSRPKGLALIINIHDFSNANDFEEFNNPNEPVIPEGSRRRFGSYRDVANMYTLLSQLGYSVTTLQDLTQARFKEELTKFRDKPEHHKVDSCFVVIMSHGIIICNHRNAMEEPCNACRERCNVLAYDNLPITCTEIWQMFNSSNCPALHNKPKIFIFQICRGDENDMGFAFYTDGSDDIVSITNGNIGDISQQMTQAVTDSKVLVDSKQMCAASNEGQRLQRQPNNSDFLLIFPCAPGTTSKRETVKGSWLIQKICEVFMEHACDKDVYDMLLQVQREISKLHNRKYGMQTVWQRISQSKKLFFNPGVYDDETSS